MSQRIRIFAAAALVALLAIAGGFLLLGGGSSSPNAAVKQIKPLHPLTRHVRTTAKRNVKKATATPKKHAAKPKKRKTPAVINGIPAALALALQRYDVVVVSLYAPGSSIDSIAKEEAHAGAAQVGAGFVALNVTNEKVAAPLTSLLTSGATAADRVLDDPAVLVFLRPSTLFVRLSGYADRATVAQAATNAAPQ